MTTKKMSGDKPIVEKYLIARVDVPAFLAFKDNQEVVRILADAGVFGIKQGKVTLNIHNGQIQSVHVDERRFQRVAGVGG